MAISKIQYDTKVAINIDSTIPDINKCNASDLNEIKSVVNNNADEIPTKTSDLSNDSGYITKDVDNLTNYVKKTDYATSTKSGVIYAEPQSGFMVGPTGKPYTPIMPYNNYSSLPNTYFISKGTLENVISGKGLIDKNVNDLTNYTKTSDLSSVATSGSYNDLIDKPTIPSISDSYGTSTIDGYSQNYINENTLNPSGEASTSEEDVSSATFTNSLEAPMNIDLKGNTLQNGTPTPSSPIPINNVSGDNDIVVSDGESDTTTYNIDLPVENLFDKTNITTGVYYDASGTSTSDNWAIAQVPVKPNTSYYLSGNTHNNTTAKIVLLDSSKNIISDVGGYSTVHTITTTSSTAYVGLSIARYIGDTDLDIMQLEQGTKPNKYTPYGTTPIELNKIGTYQDYIYKESDKWYLHKEIGKVVLNGSEDYVLATTYTNNTRFTCNSSKAMLGKTTPLLSNYFVEGTGGTDTTNIDTNGSTGQLMITIPNSIATTTNALQTWLSTHNTIVYYVLATPTNTEITDTTLIEQLESIKNAMSKEGTTNVNQVNNDAPFMLDLSVFNDTYNGRYQSVLEMYKRLSN